MLLRLPVLRLQWSTFDILTSHFLRSPTKTSGSTAIALALLVALSSAANARPTGLPSAVKPQLASPQPTSSAALPDPKTAKEFNQRGTSRVQNGDLDAAIADFSQAVRLKRDYATAYYNRGTVYASTGNVRAALADYTQVIALKPNNAAVRYSRGLLRANTGDRPGALIDFQQAAALFKQEGNTVFYQKAQDYIKQLQPV
ncbi:MULTISPECIES: tetratricopeptide repeat protein [Cyanophyceae]|uniref:Tetratricopeptide repeat protein n=1 Tax=Stenomitos frigidus AS-A4 TaxID=2933935 RepID=A0ABV0KLM5_9CYAN|nr:tetratricopeptide repeat protein [Phormidium sp. FACHB-592]